MKPDKMILISVLVLFAFSNQILALFPPQRCETIEPSQIAGRRAWVEKCFPGFGPQVMSLGLEYPTFAFVDENRLRSNPQNWFAPTSVDAPCEYPVGYRIGYCVLD